MSWMVNSTTTTIADYASFSWWFDRWHKHWQPIKIHQNLQDVAELLGCRSSHLAAAANLVSPCLVIKIILTQVDGLLGGLHATTVTTTIAENKDIVAIAFGVIWWMMKSLTVNQNPSEFTGQGVKHVAQVTRSSNMMEDIFKKGLHSLLLRPLVCNTSSLISVLFLNHSFLFTRRLLWMDHVIKVIKHLQTSHVKQMMRLESTAQRTRRDKEDLVMVGSKAVKVKKWEKYVRVGGENRERGRCRCCRDTKKKQKTEHGRAAAIALDHPSGLAERLLRLDCGLLAGLDARINKWER